MTRNSARYDEKQLRVPLTLGMIVASLLLMYLIVSHVLQRAAVTDERRKARILEATVKTVVAPTVDLSRDRIISRLGDDAGGTTALSVLHGQTVDLISGGQMNLGVEFAGHVVLVVNVASHCGFTDVNYHELEVLYQRYKKRKFTVLAFPCNQFGQQEADAPKEIELFARRTKKATFPIFDKVEVNGPHTAPLYTALKQSLNVQSIEWNFGKFLIGRDGKPQKYYDHNFPFGLLKKHIEALLG